MLLLQDRNVVPPPAYEMQTPSQLPSERFACCPFAPCLPEVGLLTELLRKLLLVSLSSPRISGQLC